ncbi:MAG: hypothetical protein KDC05_04635 [Bacteroidales bacterium]|nr:hypothetical protein [Bacteroidales bacterium]
MKKTKNVLLTAVLLWIGIQTACSQKINATLLWTTPDVLTTSESVLYDDDNKLLLVSCINGNPTDKDGNGFISQISLTGDVMLREWVTGLNAPKGMAFWGDKLYVTDIDRVVEINRSNGSIAREFPIEGASFLNDITIDTEGNIYISDSGTGKIHRIHNGIPEVWLDDENIQNPNGMNFQKNEVLIGTKTGIYGVRIEDKRIWQTIAIEGGIDGLKLYGKHDFIISDWVGHVRMVSTGDAPIMLLDLTENNMNAADMEFIEDKNLLVIPTFNDNRVAAYEISEE